MEIFSQSVTIMQFFNCESYLNLTTADICIRKNITPYKTPHITSHNQKHSRQAVTVWTYSKLCHNSHPDKERWYPVYDSSGQWISEIIMMAIIQQKDQLILDAAVPFGGGNTEAKTQKTHIGHESAT